MTDKFETLAEAREAHEARGGWLTTETEPLTVWVDRVAAFRDERLVTVYHVTGELPDWRADLDEITAAQWEAAGWDETQLPN
jgi:hypothetical protein